MATRREFLVVVGAGAIARLLTPLGEQQPIKTLRIGSSDVHSRPADPGLAFAARGHARAGLLEGKSYVIVARFANDDFTRLPRLVEELAAERVDVIVARGPSVDFTIPSGRAYRWCSRTAATPSKPGFADSCAAGRNMTGITFMANGAFRQAGRSAQGNGTESLAHCAAVQSRTPGGVERVPRHGGHRAPPRRALTRYLVRTPQELPTAFAAIPRTIPTR